MAEPTIRIEGLGKEYVIGGAESYQENFREMLASTLTAPFRKFRRLGGKDNQQERFWALKDINFDVQPGEVVGIIGRNGAGKSTLLKILSRITEPTEGKVITRGRVASLLEVGTGFHAELTGRENIYLNGAILGMSRREIQQKFDDIVAFAEVEKFLDTPVKRYSSGMYVRLAFAVAAYLEPEILVVDEVLSVGDASFQKKCLGKMGNVAKEGRTILFVSHNMKAITDLCERVVWIHDGQIKMDSVANAVVEKYLLRDMTSTGQWHRAKEEIKKKEKFTFLQAGVFQDSQTAVALVNRRLSFKVKIRFKVLIKLKDCAIVLRLTDAKGTIVFTSWDTDHNDHCENNHMHPGFRTVACHIPGELLKPGVYAITLAAHTYRVEVYDYLEDVFSFEVSEALSGLNVERAGVIWPKLRWTKEIESAI